MRNLVIVTILTVSTLAAAQQTTTPESSGTVIAPAPVWQTQVPSNQSSGIIFRAAPQSPGYVFHLRPFPLVRDQEAKGHAEIGDLLFDPGLMPYIGCYTMRTYSFSRGAIPRPTGYTTCVPSAKLQLRQARPVPRVSPQ